MTQENRVGRDTTRAHRQDFRTRAVARLKQVGWTLDARTSCLIWNGPTDGSGGYGRVQVGERHVDAHRLSLELSLGRPIEPGMFAIHSCDRPRCIAPHHLREGTPRDNMRDRLERTGYFGATLTHCARGHEYDAETLRIDVDRAGRERRRCRKCERIRALARAVTP